MRPLARTVELEGKEVIRLGKPLPGSLATRTRPSGDWTVIGRTTGLFGTTDSIAVGLHPTRRVVREIRLTYLGDGAYSVMEARLRDVFGIQEYERSYRNRITFLSLARNGGTLGRRQPRQELQVNYRPKIGRWSIRIGVE